MLTRLLVALAFIALAPAGASAQIYRWVDDQGGVHYTEGIGSVPERFRGGARVIVTPPPPPPAVPTPHVAPPPPAPAAPSPSTSQLDRAGPAAPPAPRLTAPSPGADRYRATASTGIRIVRVVYPPPQLKSPMEVTDYPDAVALVLFGLQRAAGLPPVSAVDVVICANAQIMEAVLVEKWRDPMVAHDTARFVAGVALGADRIVINETAMIGKTRAALLKLLAHEMAHVVQAAQLWLRLDAWLVEGFAEWSAYRVVHWLGVADYTALRQGSLRNIVRASDRSLPRLGDLGRDGQWVASAGSIGRAGTYDQGFLAVEYLIREKGFDTVIGYFHASIKATDRLQTFQQAFGESFDQFEARFASHLRALLP